MYQVDNISLAGLPWRANAPSDYFQACHNCEIFVEADAELVQDLLRILKEDRRKDGARGLAVTAAIARAPQLQQGDRLEPSQELPDVGQLSSVTSFPIRLTFWRTSREVDTRHRNPLFDEALGITVVDTMTVDTLHCLNLGVLLVWVSVTLWLLVERRVFSAHASIDETIGTAARLVKAELDRFYRRYKEANPVSNLTRVQDFSRNTLGESTSGRRLRTKGAETWGVALYLLHKLESLSAAHQDDETRSLFRAGKALADLVELWSRSGRVLDAATVQRGLDLWKIHLRFTQDFPDMEIPKRHLMTHMVKGGAWHGNPRMYACWADEGLNRELKKSCRLVSQQSFEPFILLTFRERLRTGIKRHW